MGGSSSSTSAGGVYGGGGCQVVMLRSHGIVCDQLAIVGASGVFAVLEEQRYSAVPAPAGHRSSVALLLAGINHLLGAQSRGRGVRGQINFEYGRVEGRIVYSLDSISSER